MLAMLLGVMHPPPPAAADHPERRSSAMRRLKYPAGQGCASSHTVTATLLFLGAASCKDTILDADCCCSRAIGAQP